ncbi:MAG TPA: gamma-glutamylcyclotransferase [Micromonosporaceae bacterium]|nr:gamma-glutamylcyclotransferase [Micromonosporaceae bacterium]HCU49142.1 gamma-glutamylcyclotransferase [Micromonosporaceae bacterium]
MTLMFLNGGAMRGGPLHHLLRDAPLVGEVRTAARYRFYSVGDRFPALEEVRSGGVEVLGEVYDVPMEVLRDSLLPAEPPELELGVIELADRRPSLAMVLRREFSAHTELKDISTTGDWKAYRDQI